MSNIICGVDPLRSTQTAHRKTVDCGESTARKNYTFGEERNDYVMTKVILIAGLPGSGKTTHIRQNYPEDKYTVYDDYKCKAINNCSKFDSSRHFTKLIENLNNAKDCVIADIDFCKDESREEAERILQEYAPNAERGWIFFENNPEACRNLFIT